MSSRFWTSIVTVCLCFALYKLGIAQEPSSKSGNTPTGSGLTIYTVPPGLKVYISPDEGRPVKRENDEGVPIVDKHSALSKPYFKGVTPLTVAIPPGRYLIAVAPIKLLNSGYQLAAIDPSFTARAFVSFEPIKEPGSLDKSIKDGLMGAAVYEFTRDASAHQVLAVRACEWDTPLKAFEAVYPPRPTFSFNEEQLRKELIDAKLPQPDVERVIALLRRGGRVSVTHGDLGWWITLKPEGKWTIETKLREPPYKSPY